MRVFFEVRQIDPRPLLQSVERKHNEERGNDAKAERAFVHCRI
jgi:hypothetical protein